MQYRCAEFMSHRSSAPTQYRRYTDMIPMRVFRVLGRLLRRRSAVPGTGSALQDFTRRTRAPGRIRPGATLAAQRLHAARQIKRTVQLLHQPDLARPPRNGPGVALRPIRKIERKSLFLLIF